MSKEEFKKYIYIAVDEVGDEEEKNYEVIYKQLTEDVTDTPLNLREFIYHYQEIAKAYAKLDVMVGYSDYDNNEDINAEINK